MSMNIIEEFQTKAYKALKSDEKLKSLVSDIYYSISDNRKYPFICINYTKITKILLHNIARFQIKLELLLFIENFNPAMSNDIMQRATDLLIEGKLPLNLADIISIDNVNIDYQIANDLITNKITSHFIVNLQQKI